MVHPFQRLSPSSFHRLFWPLLLVTILLMIWMNVLSQPLVNGQAPLGIISFELAGTQTAAAEILNSWDSKQQKIASFSLGLDYLFIPLYAMTLSLACAKTATIISSKKRVLGAVGILLAWSQWGAAVLDGTENFALINMLLENSKACLAWLANWCAIFKFGIIIAGITWCLFALVVILYTSRNQRARQKDQQR